MLKKIPVQALRLGMYLHAFEGSWVQHPFWRTRFLLTNEADLQAVRGSEIRECWIDVSQGADVGTPAAAATPALAAAAAGAQAPAPAGKPGRAPAKPRVELASELPRAAALRRRMHETMNQVFADARLGKAVDAKACAPLVEAVVESVFRHPGALVALVRLKARDDYTCVHGVAVCTLMIALARQLGMTEDECREAGLAGLLHDVGKAFIPLDLLNKPTKLDDSEMALVKTHAQRGYDALADVDPAVGDVVLDVSLHHHERLDGSGYPHGLRDEAIGLRARMAAVCDVYDAITSPRPYRGPADAGMALQAMARCQQQFDATVFQALVRAVGIYPTGSLVRLESGRLAVVAEQNESSLVSPWVKPFYSARGQVHLVPEMVDLSRPGCSDRIIGRELAAEWGFKELDRLWMGVDNPRARA